MITLRKPTQKIEFWLKNKWMSSSFNYSEVGDTRNEKMPVGYHHDNKYILLGKGEQTFLRAKEAIEKWKMYGMDWIGVHSDILPLEKNQVSVTFLKMGLWATNPCRIIYVVDTREKDIVRFGFAFGTVADHPEAGEELFLVEWNLQDDCVYYKIKAFSRPRHFLAVLGSPFTRYLQNRFFCDSLEAVKRYVEQT